MARYDFGGTLADFVVTSRRLGGLDVLGLSAATLTFWSAQSGGTQYTDLQLNGSATSSIAVASDGQVPTFQGPDSVTGMWADGGSGRVRIVAQGVPGPAGPVGPGAINSVDAAKTAPATLTASHHTPVDATSGAQTMTLPTGAAVGTLISVEKTDASANAVNVTGTLRGVTSSTIPLTAQYDARTFLSEGSGSWRPVSDHRTATALNNTITAATKPTNAVNPITGMFHVDQFGAGPAKTATQNATALQAALDAAGGIPVYIPQGVYQYNATLKLDTNQNVRCGSIGAASSNAQPTILQYVGANATNGIEVKNPGSTSRVSIDGLRLEDKRVGATSGSGIYIDAAKNKITLKNINSFYWPSYPVFIGSSTGSSSVENIELESIWVSGGAAGGAGVYISNVDNVATLKSIYGDSQDAAGFPALVKIDKCAGGNAAITLEGLKAEINNGAHVLQVGSQFSAVLTANGVIMRGPTAGTGGDVVRVDATNTTTVLHIAGIASNSVAGTGQACANLVNDVGIGKVYGAGPTASVGRMALYMRSGNKCITFKDGTFDLTNATVTGVAASTATSVSMANAPRAGRFAVAKGGTTSTVGLTNAIPRYAPVAIKSDATLTSLGVNVTTVGSTGAIIRIALFADDGAGFPTGNSLTEVTVDATILNYRSATVSVPLTAGIYHAAVVSQGAPTTAPVITGFSSASMVEGVVCWSGGQTATAGYLDSRSTITGTMTTSAVGGNASGPVVYLGF